MAREKRGTCVFVRLSRGLGWAPAGCWVCVCSCQAIPDAAAPLYTQAG